MSKTVLKVENISKQYRLGQVGTGTISHDLNRWWHAIRGKPDPYLKVGDLNERTQKGESEYVWALKDINFEVKEGEVLGIIGRNGAGKSTLLKLLCKITSPTTGTIKRRGRIASLLEVGTGFHPELTGRENIYLNGAILGMTKREITSKLDEIVDFAGVERYLDTPVKRYSSGMMVRLGFSVAAHLEPEILVVDEVLAVGDAEFQQKCIGKMGSVAKQGRTVLFVSHNLPVIQTVCDRGILLNSGYIEKKGLISKVLDAYKSNNLSTTGSSYSNEYGNGLCHFENILVSVPDGNAIYMGDTIEVSYTIQSEIHQSNFQICVQVYDEDFNLISCIYNTDFNIFYNLTIGTNNFHQKILLNNILPGKYYFGFKAMYNYGVQVFHETEAYIQIQIEPKDLMKSGRPFLKDRGFVWFEIKDS